MFSLNRQICCLMVNEITVLAYKRRKNFQCLDVDSNNNFIKQTVDKFREKMSRVVGI